MKTLAIVYSVLLFTISCSSVVSKRNAENINKVEIGMTINDVKQIMGDPEKTIIHSFNIDEYELLYLSPSGYSDHFRVFVSRKDSVVVRIGNGL